MTSLKEAEDYVTKMTHYYSDKAKVRKKPNVRFTRRLNTTSAEVYPKESKYIYNRDYVELNKKNKTVLRCLAAHEVAHVASKGAGDSDIRFKKKYKELTGRNDPQHMPKERMEPPRFAYICPKCKRVWFLMRKPKKEGYCSYDGTKLRLKSVSDDRYMRYKWDDIVRNGNRMV